jgi:hypothetical protein
MGIITGVMSSNWPRRTGKNWQLGSPFLNVINPAQGVPNAHPIPNCPTENVGVSWSRVRVMIGRGMDGKAFFAEVLLVVQP